MLRMLRVLGIIIFAGLTAVSAYNLRSIYRSGELYDAYSTAGRGQAALLVFSAVGFGGLGYLEIIRSNRSSRRFGQGRPVTNFDDEDVRKKAANIYSTPKTSDDWALKHRRGKPKPQTKQVEFSAVWIGVLKFIGFVLPLIYSGMLIEHWAANDEMLTLNWLIRGYLIWMVLCSTAAAVGILNTMRWGQIAGYILSMFNLLMFPYGIAIGLILLVFLVGAGPVFTQASLERQKEKRRRSSRRSMGRAVV